MKAKKDATAALHQAYEFNENMRLKCAEGHVMSPMKTLGGVIEHERSGRGTQPHRQRRVEMSAHRRRSADRGVGHKRTGGDLRDQQETHEADLLARPKGLPYGVPGYISTGKKGRKSELERAEPVRRLGTPSNTPGHLVQAEDGTRKSTAYFVPDLLMQRGDDEISDEDLSEELPGRAR